MSESNDTYTPTPLRYEYWERHEFWKSKERLSKNYTPENLHTLLGRRLYNPLYSEPSYMGMYFYLSYSVYCDLWSLRGYPREDRVELVAASEICALLNGHINWYFVDNKYHDGRANTHG